MGPTGARWPGQVGSVGCYLVRGGTDQAPQAGGQGAQAFRLPLQRQEVLSEERLRGDIEEQHLDGAEDDCQGLVKVVREARQLLVQKTRRTG